MPGATGAGTEVSRDRDGARRVDLNGCGERTAGSREIEGIRMSDVTHVNDRQLLRAIDGEMTPVEHAEFETHLARCETCLERWEALAEVWNEIERTIEATPVEAPRGAREQLVEALADGKASTAARAGRRISSWYWAAAIAATAAILFFALREP